MDQTPQHRLFGMNRIIFVIGLVSFLTDLSSQMIVPILPLYLTTVLHVQVATVGVIEGIAESIASILKWLSGWASDRYGKSKPLMVAGYALSNLVKPLFALSTTWGQILAIRLADRFGKGVRSTARDTLLANSTSKEERGRAFGFRRSMDALGAAIGPLVAVGILGWSGGNYQVVFWASAVPGILAVLLLIFFLKERSREKLPSTRRTLPKITFKNMNTRVIGFTLIATLFSIGNFSDAFLVLRAQDVGMAIALIPLAYLTFNLTSSLFSVPLGILSDRLGRKPLIVSGYLIFAAIYLGFGLVKSVGWIWVLFVLYGLYYAATEGIQKAYIADLVPEEQRGTALGTFNALTGMAALPASVLAGLFWQNFGPLVAFGSSSLLAVLAAILLLMQKDDRQVEKS
ncbi:Na+/melibiose symporter-like transporter [Tumebacillus sp. BK434]|uniref:MFS transporter n=1 Tax=Tumebacillus sp. BK434 TaxID=2512169 RepID=UPI0010D0A93E|nr:MFS transporter [Tumebacillus sp. BK434]TCP57885.1 Na+/melibiose symporter-like transporter [Tumebacillus sp. BK434]